MGPWIQKKNTPHTTFGGLWGQNSLSFQTNASWAAHQNHFNKLRNVFWGMEMSRNSFSKMGFLLRVVVTSQSGCQNKTSCYQNKKIVWLNFCSDCVQTCFCWGKSPRNSWGWNSSTGFFVTKLRSINRINRHCWAVRGQNHGAHQASRLGGRVSPRPRP